MHQIVLMTALTAASGLFSGGRQHAAGRYGRAYAPVQSVAPVASPYYAPQPAPAYAPAPAQASRAAYYQSNYYAPQAAPCATGNCPRR